MLFNSYLTNLDGLWSRPSQPRWFGTQGMGQLFIGFRGRRPASATVRAGHRKIGTNAPEQLDGSSAQGCRRPAAWLCLKYQPVPAGDGCAVHVDYQSPLPGSLQRLPIAWNSALITDHPRLLPSGRVTQFAVLTDLIRSPRRVCGRESPTLALPFMQRRRVLRPLPISSV